MKLLLENWRQYLAEQDALPLPGTGDRGSATSIADLPPEERPTEPEPSPISLDLQKPSYLLFHWPSNKLHWMNTSEKYAFRTPTSDKLPPGNAAMSWTATSGKLPKLPGMEFDPDEEIKKVIKELPKERREKLKTKEMKNLGPIVPGVYTTRDAQDMPERLKNWFIDGINLAWHGIKVRYLPRLGPAGRALADRMRSFTEWPGGTKAWGEHRVWLQPAGAAAGVGHARGGFTIHGGDEWGSSGCIDMGNNIKEFSGYFKAYNLKHRAPMLLYAHYGSLKI